MPVAWVVVAALETLYQIFIKNHAFIYTAAKSDKNSLNPAVRASALSVWIVVVYNDPKGKSLGGRCGMENTFPS